MPGRTKNRVYLNYGIRRHAPDSYEVDHLISLELGGSNSVKNLWPEKQPGARGKGKLENRLHAQVCDGTISLRTAQKRIVRWWLYSQRRGVRPVADLSSAQQRPRARVIAANANRSTAQRPLSMMP